MDPRETVAELTARAHEISQQAGSKVGAAMKNVIGAAAGLTGFAVESARDLIQYMVRRGQMTQMEGDKLLREVEAAHGTRSPSPKTDAPRSASKAAAPPAARPASEPTLATEKPARQAKKAAAPAIAKPAPEKPARKSADKVPTPKSSAKKAPAKGAAKTAAPKGSASRSSAASRPKAASKSAPIKRKK
jgi:outer membrane biosynthesis protein TonB